jgi:hypothetical protein
MVTMIWGKITLWMLFVCLELFCNVWKHDYNARGMYISPPLKVRRIHYTMMITDSNTLVCCICVAHYKYGKAKRLYNYGNGFLDKWPNHRLSRCNKLKHQFKHDQPRQKHLSNRMWIATWVATPISVVVGTTYCDQKLPIRIGCHGQDNLVIN